MYYWKTKNKIICQHFLIDDTCKKATDSQNTYCHLDLWKKMGQIVNLIVALYSILVPCDWKWLCFFAFYVSLLIILHTMKIKEKVLENRQVTVVPVKESAWHTSTSVLGIDWGIAG